MSVSDAVVMCVIGLLLLTPAVINTLIITTTAITIPIS